MSCIGSHFVLHKTLDMNDWQGLNQWEFYLHANSHHHPSQKMTLINTLFHRADNISDSASKNLEKMNINTALKQNGYKNKQIFSRIAEKQDIYTRQTTKLRLPAKEPQTESSSYLTKKYA